MASSQNLKTRRGNLHIIASPILDPARLVWLIHPSSPQLSVIEKLRFRQREWKRESGGRGKNEMKEEKKGCDDEN